MGKNNQSKVVRLGLTSGEKAKQKLAAYEKDHRKYTIIGILTFLGLGGIAFGIYANAYIILGAETTTGYVYTWHMHPTGDGGEKMQIEYSYIVEGKEYKSYINYYVYNDYRKGDSIYIEYSPSSPTKHNTIGIAYRDGFHYALKDE